MQLNSFPDRIRAYLSWLLPMPENTGRADEYRTSTGTPDEHRGSTDEHGRAGRTPDQHETLSYVFTDYISGCGIFTPSHSQLQNGDP